MAIFLKRDTKVYLERFLSDNTTPVIWEIPVLDGFSFSQGNTTSETVLSEMEDSSGNSKRGRRMFNDALAPADWSFSTYIRPFTSTGSDGADTNPGHHHAIEEALWANFVGTGAPTEVTGPAYAYTHTNFTIDGTGLNINFEGSNKSTLGTFNLYFVMGANNAASANYTAGSTLEIYKMTDCVVNEATINFEVDGIAMIDWSGNGSLLTTAASLDATSAITADISATDNFIRNKLTALDVTADDDTKFPGAGGGSYNFTLTGGSITFSNNITYLTPETLGIVNQPIGHITGNKSISGNFTCYVNSGTAGDSGDFFDDLTATGARDVITNSFALVFKIGGSGNTPRMEISLPTAHIEIPTIQSDDVIGVDMAFHGLPSTITSDDEATLLYVGA
jgi:hypothetical protein